ncbi:MAG: nucleoside-diphosphate kinase [Deltaproteobacteria bacterium RIFCSPLOWO2_12_FULL_40_28]|nr:MAG: nucleoside-diphosphate kinase [Deltaproteobacteria bacterium RIFCSPHIGHO2_02_FULL_40_28]OGQ18837.1 MAG: nucleoside-diphosphate kinase [Deltaproteobacteria bacterium RIFCSPHIGHO2_12_FULL_40_32]OGQ40082.1 MAG: nucleoside-diphosphate kinase [Deltaproteobacteria bacterium RIFCSPLOWO2_02_FULL_40_36]OGQ53265.1 MAG: nucleoside-diphosphate kinase [Deltaproteobacteria bacterium RIFCSPLOWO2_12_FULL_40_28]
MKELTLGIIKPDGVRRNLIGNIFSRVEKAELKIAAARMLKLDRAKAEGFYAVHKARPFFGSLVESMMAGNIVVFVLSGDNAITRWRELMGATDPSKAEKGTIRADLAENIERNTVHGSDALDTAKREVAYFFKEDEIF